MAFVPIQYLRGHTTTFTSVGATAIVMDSASTALLLSLLGASGNYTTVSVFDGVNYELMKLTGVTGGTVTVTRAQEGTTAVPLASGAAVTFVYTETSILAIAPGGSVTCAGSGGTNVSGGPNYVISSPVYAVTAGAGITVSGSPGGPSYVVSSTVPSGPAGATGATGPAVTVTASGIAVASGGPSTYNVAVPATSITAGAGVTVTGAGTSISPYIITNAQTQGGTGTVTSLVAGTGITISGGTPTINPTVSLTATGVTPGAYGGVTLNAAGQVTAIASGFVTGITTTTVGLVVATPTIGNYTVNGTAATTAAQGLTTYAAATSAASNNASDATHSVTPAGVNAVINALTITPTTLTSTGSQVALSAGTYTTAIAGLTSLSVTVPTGKTAILNIYVEVNDLSNPTVVQSFAIGLFNVASLLAGNSIIPSCTRNLHYLITGPLTATLTVKTTALTGTMALSSYNAQMVMN